jgi:hypothetical protein
MERFELPDPIVDPVPVAPVGAVTSGPAWKDGDLVRAVADGKGYVWPEMFDKPTGRWVPGASLRDVISGVLVSPEWAAKKGIPASAFDDPLQARRDRAEVARQKLLNAAGDISAAIVALETSEDEARVAKLHAQAARDQLWNAAIALEELAKLADAAREEFAKLVDPARKDA